MAIIIQCDGCTSPITEPIAVGQVIKREYCEDCAKLAEQFLDAEIRLRKSIHDEFLKCRVALVKKFSAKSFKLPDVV